ncbi:HNH endonuclease [Nesterenkonia massiliensis]|uniref:HNH endonuclease n=1 Tax=Nesterenkonia massiliensis TaxID=1232429 RepID=A0ABT2HSI7_9MICC|nr:HNH endonuclease [Nesterenkonia massiliensis]MCT1607637.1 HNH endonuclease [Nesterenkonia massiliensis]
MRTLVLNAGYEPLSVVTSRRAAVLVMHGKASMLAEEGKPILSPSTLMPRPAVILLHQYVRVSRRRPSPPSRRGILRRDRRLCAYCGKSAATVDHVVPRSRGGDSSWENLVACCSPCNVRKGDKTLEQLGWRLNVTPQAPSQHMWLPQELDAPHEAWMPFLDHTSV